MKLLGYLPSPRPPALTEEVELWNMVELCDQERPLAQTGHKNLFPKGLN